jgi:hypothetical protein
MSFAPCTFWAALPFFCLFDGSRVNVLFYRIYRENIIAA